MSTKLGVKIGEGGCSEVFEWEDDTKIIKLAKPNTSVEGLKLELHNTTLAWENGLSVPQAFNLVYVDNRPGIVFERVHGITLMEHMLTSSPKHTIYNSLSTPADDHYEARITAQVLHAIHLKSVDNGQLQRVNLAQAIQQEDYLTSVEKEKILSYLDTLPIKQQFCHGDPNPNNILLSNGTAVTIDWTNASIGNPEADLAEYIIMIRFAILPTHLPSEVTVVFDTIRESIVTSFVEEYTSLSDISLEDIEAWILPVAARKLLADGVSEAEKQLLILEIRRRLALL